MTKMNVVIELTDGTIEIDYPIVPPEPVVSVVPTIDTPDVYGEVVVRYPDGAPVMDPKTGKDLKETTLLQSATYKDIEVTAITPDRKLYDRSETDFLNEMSRRMLDRNPGATLVGVNIDIPDLTFRPALRKKGAGVAIDMPKAREIQMGRIRAARDKMWKPLDALENEAVSKEDADMIADARQKKKVMRAIPNYVEPLLAEANTPEDLKEFWPEILDK